MTTYQLRVPLLNTTLPTLGLVKGVRRALALAKTERIIRQLSTEQLKDIGLYRETKPSIKPATQQLW